MSLTQPRSPLQLAALEFGAGAAAALVATPASLALSVWLGTLSNSLIWAALPAALAFVAIPPLAVVLAEWATANALLPGSARLSPTVWVSLGAQVLVLVGAILLGAHGANVGDAALLTLVEMLVLPGASTAMIHWTSPPPDQAASVNLRAPSFDDPQRVTLDRATSLSLAAWRF